MSETIEPHKPLLKRYTGTCLKVSEVATILAVTPTSVRRWAENGLIQAIELPRKAMSQRRHWRIIGGVVDEIIENGGLPEIQQEKE